MCKEACRICGALLDVVPRVVAEEGGPVSLDVVAARAGLGVDDVRRHLGADALGALVRAAYEAAAEDLLTQYRLGFDGASTFLVGLEQSHLRLARALLMRPDVARMCSLAASSGDRGLFEAALRRRARLVEFLAERHASLGERPLPSLQLEMLVGCLSRQLARMVEDPSFVERRPMAVANELTAAARVFAPSARLSRGTALEADAATVNRAG